MLYTESELQVVNNALEIMERKISGLSLKAFNSSTSFKSYLRLKMSKWKQERFCAAFLNNQHELISFEKMFTGTINSTAVYPREVVRKAIEHNAAAVVFAHNHPSGTAEPSHADIAITRKLKDALALIDVTVLDHFVVGNTVTSFAEKGLI